MHGAPVWIIVSGEKHADEEPWTAEWKNNNLERMELRSGIPSKTADSFEKRIRIKHPPAMCDRRMRYTLLPSDKPRESDTSILHPDPADRRRGWAE